MPEFLPALSANEEKILAALEQPTEINFVDRPLRDVVEYLGEYHRKDGLQVQFDSRAMEDIGIESDVPVSINVKGLSLRAALSLLLSDHDLVALVKDDVLMITTADVAESRLVTRAYPVGDLLEPSDEMDYEGKEYNALVEAITECVEPDSWEKSRGRGNIAVVGDVKCLVISQTRDVHRDVLQLLRSLRAGRKMQPAR
ncbi:MAG: hypothetical protein DWQ37_16245 [Planctomycetota bacterium]|nr:MAG: hypothetical protein DWQ37_16245 [Planctomycetota bacterium]